VLAGHCGHEVFWTGEYLTDQQQGEPVSHCHYDPWRSTSGEHSAQHLPLTAAEGFDTFRQVHRALLSLAGASWLAILACEGA